MVLQGLDVSKQRKPLPSWRFHSGREVREQRHELWYKVASAAENTAVGRQGWVSALAGEVCLKQGSRTEWLLGGKQEACLLSPHSGQGAGEKTVRTQNDGPSTAALTASDAGSYQSVPRHSPGS